MTKRSILRLIRGLMTVLVGGIALNLYRQTGFEAWLVAGLLIAVVGLVEAVMGLMGRPRS